MNVRITKEKTSLIGNSGIKVNKLKVRPIDSSKTINTRRVVQQEDEPNVKNKLFQIKQQRIRDLELELSEGKSALIDFYIEIADYLGIREANDTKVYHLKPEEIISEIEKIISPLLNIQADIDEMVKVENKLTSNEDEEILAKKLLSDLRETMRESLQIDFFNEIISLRQEQLLETQSHLTRRHYDMIDSYKEELRLMLKIVDFREKEISELRKDIDKKNEMIKTLKEKLLSMVVLEYKAGELEKMYKKDMEMLERKYNRELDEIRNVRKFDPNILMQQITKQEELKNVKVEIFKESKKRKNFMEFMERKKKRLEHEMESTEEKIAQRNQDIENLRQKLKVHSIT